MFVFIDQSIIFTNYYQILPVWDVYYDTCYLYIYVSNNPFLSQWLTYALTIIFAKSFTEAFCSHATASSSTEWSKLRRWLLVCRRTDVSSTVLLWRFGAQRPWPSRKQFNIDQVERLMLKPGSRIVRSETTNLFVTEDDCQSDFHLNATFDQTGFLIDAKVDGWISPGTVRVCLYKLHQLRASHTSWNQHAVSTAGYSYFSP